MQKTIKTVFGEYGSVYKLNKGETPAGRDVSRCTIAFQGRLQKKRGEIPSLSTSKSSEILKETTHNSLLFAVSFCVFLNSARVTLDTEQCFISLWHFLFPLCFYSDTGFGEWEVSGYNNSASSCIL